MSSLLSHIFRLLIARVGLLLVSGDRRDSEILALRHQILVLQRPIDRPSYAPTDRTILAVLTRALDRRHLDRVMLIVKPATVIGWHRRLVARHWTQPPSPRTGRPPTATELRQLVLRLDGENPTWGYRRSHGEMRCLGHRIAAATVWKILRNAGREPIPNRTGPTWSEFIGSQAHAMLATERRRHIEWSQLLYAGCARRKLCAKDGGSTNATHNLGRPMDEAREGLQYMLAAGFITSENRLRGPQNASLQGSGCAAPGVRVR